MELKLSILSSYIYNFSILLIFLSTRQAVFHTKWRFLDYFYFKTRFIVLIAMVIFREDEIELKNFPVIELNVD